MTPEQKNMIEEFQCPGCTCGMDIKCGHFGLDDSNCAGGFRCSGHSAGTFMSGVGCIALGLPKGFNHYGALEGSGKAIGMQIQLFTKNSKFDFKYNALNLPVWAMVKDGYLFVRVYSPRTNLCRIQVFEGKMMDFIKEQWTPTGDEGDIGPSAPILPCDVAEFYDKID